MFFDAWELRKLGDITKRVRGNDGRMDLPTLTISAGSGWLDQKDRFSGNIAGKEQMNYTLLKKGQLSYNHGNSKLAKYGAVFELKTYDEALVPRVYHSFETNVLATSDFIEYIFATKRPDRELAKLVSSGARMDGLLNINFNEFVGINVNIPSVEEQQKIGSFFKQIDNTIALHQRKLDTLKQMKKGFLQQMFPENEEKVPKVRFAGFEEEWALRKFHNLVDTNNGIRRGPFGSALKKDLFVKESDYVVYEQQNAIYNKYETRYNITKDKYEELIKFKVLPGDFIMSGAGTIGRISLVPEGIKHGVFNQALIRFKLNHEKTDSKYFLQLMRSENMQRMLTGSNPGSAMINLVPMSEVKNWDILVPELEEQKLLGIFFTNIDNIIAFHQQKLDQLKILKKAYLQNMFI
ncbi:restriction endonuclease subunit S [Paenilisteria rocourtiae]|uniref:Type I restriction enzyme S subunit n=1 Tax=Listeria rocourtiae TaxID=647910 RepID=A0A4R6ZKD1_9LIST|nr:restriction endonuclease subunit S [Listeria rocourtiae]TDR52803.1 type I restriction enzyme S subunit [Listeria rocourtiae]